MAAISSLIPLILLFVVLGAGGFIAYHIYLWSNELTERGKNKMAKKNMSFTKEGGLRVGVKEMRDEKYADKTQNVLVNVWNNAALPNYKSRLGWNSTQAQEAKKSSSSRPSGGSRTPSSSSTSRPSNSRSNTTSSQAAASNLSPPEARPSAKRTPSTPGSW